MPPQSAELCLYLGDVSSACQTGCHGKMKMEMALGSTASGACGLRPRRARGSTADEAKVTYQSSSTAPARCWCISGYQQKYFLHSQPCV